jgi:MHS family shikimate/dehydroshikimate transporter-like MFS transporter
MPPRRVAVAATIGTAIEWYDFYVYGTSVVLVLGPLFFPTDDPLTSTLLAFSTFGVGFLVRPLGAVVLSHFGDRVGRRQALVFSLLLMGMATVAVGLLPTYAQVGVLAPLLLALLRCAQGFAVGGEWGGAVLLAVEHAPQERRARYGSLPQYGTPIGLMTSSGAILLAGLMPAAQFQAWGWRLPFLASFPLVAVGLWVRLKISESEEFVAARATGATVRSPVATTLRQHWRAVLAGTAVTLLCHAAYIITTFLPGYATAVLGVADAAALSGLILGSVVSIAVLASMGGVLDRRVPWRFAAVGGAASGVWIFPAFAFAGTGEGMGLVLGTGVGLGLVMVQYAAIPALLAGLFPVHLRYSGISLCFQLSAVIGGAAVPILASALVRRADGSYLPAAGLMAAAGVATLLGALACRRRPSTLGPVEDASVPDVPPTPR